MLKITSKANTHLKELAKLYASKRQRRESGCFVLEGVRLVCDALESGAAIRSLFVTDEGIRRLGERFEPLCEAAKETFLLDGDLALRIGDTEHPQGVFAVCEGELVRHALPEGELGCLVLCSLQDPGNVGTILRAAAAFGVPVVMSADCPDPASPKVLRAAMGLRTAFVSDDILDAIDRLKAGGRRVLAAALSDESVPVDGVSLKGAAVVIGNEGSGLPADVIARCDGQVILPMQAGCESLNAAVAASIFAWEISRAERGVSD